MSTLDMKTPDNKGFTLIEVIAVLIILGIIAAVAVSRVSSNQSDLIPQTDIVKSHLRFAQLKALADDVQVDGVTASTWGIVFSETYYTLYNNNNPATTSTLPGASDGAIHTFPSGVTVVAAPVTFNSWGNPGATIKITLTQNGNKDFWVYNNTGYIGDTEPTP
jgi:prepilin-type N-terminal cleavage/methylation domain-containing protein